MNTQTIIDRVIQSMPAGFEITRRPEEGRTFGRPWIYVRRVGPAGTEHEVEIEVDAERTQLSPFRSRDSGTFRVNVGKNIDRAGASYFKVTRGTDWSVKLAEFWAAKVPAMCDRANAQARAEGRRASTAAEVESARTEVLAELGLEDTYAVSTGTYGAPRLGVSLSNLTKDQLRAVLSAAKAAGVKF